MNKQNTILLTILCISFLLIAFFGYTYYSDAIAIQQIKVEIEEINNINPKVTSATLRFTMNITNPTSKPINDLSSTFDIYIESNYVGKGSFSDIDIDPFSTTYESMSVIVYYNGLADAGVDLIKNWVHGEKTKLTINGTMAASVLFGLAEASHEFTGST